MRCLVADELHPCFSELLKDKGLSLNILPELSEMQFRQEMASAEILVIRSRFSITRDLLEASPALKLIARAGAGLDGIDVASAEARGIRVIHAAEGNAAAVAEHVVGMVLGLLARIPEADRALRSGIWNREGFRGRELGRRCVGLIGYGNMGPAVARRLHSFGCRVIAYDKYRPDWPDDFAERVDLDEIRQHADIISLHVPLTEETRGMVNAEFLQQCRPGLILLNTSRGPVLNLSGVGELLESGQLSGLALDVFPEEPLFKKNIAYQNEISSLLQRPDVLATPHVAGWTLESYRKISEVLAQKIISEIPFLHPQNSGNYPSSGR
jgi:D-3-phosphoglycerate dehydrogenase